MADETKTYILESLKGQQRKVTVPATWKVTFGPTVPYERKSHGGNEQWALRFYESKDKLRAIFTDVRSFRDASIDILERRVQTKRQVMEKASQKGGRSVVAEARVEEWIDPDDPDSSVVPDDYLRISHDEEEEGGGAEF